MGAAAKALKVAHGKMYVKRFLSKFRFNSMLKSSCFNNSESIYFTYIVLIFNDFKGNMKVYCCGWVPIALKISRK